ncbi:hypothetical protein D3C81_2218900 [compost metagenome]
MGPGIEGDARFDPGAQASLSIIRRMLLHRLLQCVHEALRVALRQGSQYIRF